MKFTKYTNEIFGKNFKLYKPNTDHYKNHQ